MLGSFAAPTRRTPLALRLLGALVLLIPAGLLGWAAARAAGTPHQPVLAAGLAVTLLFGLSLLRQPDVWRSACLSVIALYLAGLLWVWFCTTDYEDWFPHFAQAVLMVVPLVLFAVQVLTASGTSAARRARLLADRLAARADWPDNLADCRALPEVKALREALYAEAAPALVLLMHPKPQVRVAALAALEFRTSWRPGQAEVVLQAARYATEPAVRAAAVTALANADDPELIFGLTPFLRDPSPEVRRAAVEALLWDAPTRWGWVREPLHAALADPRAANDGPLPCSGMVLPPQAVHDLTGWAGESGPISLRAALTLSNHYRRALADNDSPQLVRSLIAHVTDRKAPAVLRIELAHLLRENEALLPQTLEMLIDNAQPSPLRLLAAEMLLLGGSEDPRLIDVLREVARNPNREIALATAVVIQKCLRVDLGLPIGEPPPPPQSRKAAEVTRRVMLWAAQPDPYQSPIQSMHSGAVSGLRVTNIGLRHTNVPRPSVGNSGQWKW